MVSEDGGAADHATGDIRDGAVAYATGVVREWDDFGNCVRMRIYESGATVAACMTDDPNCPFRMYTFPEMTEPAKSGIPILTASVFRKPAGRSTCKKKTCCNA